MKKHPMSAQRPQIRPVVRPIALILSVALFGFTASPMRAQVNQLDIGVRSTLMDKPLGKSHLQDLPQHGKVYAVLAVHLIPEQERMVKPMDEHKLLTLVRHELDTHGFHPFVKPARPDILITVEYGRAWLRNPYYADAQPVYEMKGPVPVQDLGMDNPTLLLRLREHGVEAKGQKAQFEKLCIKVTAWQYSSDPKAKAKQLWHTIMNVDDPDHRDLNAIAEQMLAAGAPYFDREIKEEEVDVFKPLPDGHVKVGTPEVVENLKTKESSQRK